MLKEISKPVMPKPLSEQIDMSTKLLDYKLDDITVSNPDGSFELTFTDAKVVAGPGKTALGKYPKALDLGAAGKGEVDVSSLAIDTQRFTLRVIFQINDSGTGRMNIITSSRLPFALYLAPRSSDEFNLFASVFPAAHGWRSANTRFASGLKPGVWYIAALVYDVDTVALFVDEAIVSVHAFKWGTINETGGHDFFIGTAFDGARSHFDGKIAAIQWLAGIPEALQAQMDERRSHPEWFITYKLESLREQLDLGEPLSAIALQSGSGSYIQHYQQGALMYHDSVGAAFELHGAIYALYRTLFNPSVLGYLVTDESTSTNSSGRKSVFSKGAIYWSQATGAVLVRGQVYLDYEALGEARAIGFPIRPAQSISGGLEQEFQNGRMYHKSGQSNAHAVIGAILAKYLALGGPAVRGFPITHETEVHKDSQIIGRFSEFEGCTIYWSSATGAFEVHGDIRQRFHDLGGPAGSLGFPTSDEMDIPGVAGGRFNSFQNGSLLWYGSAASIVLARPFHLFIGRINAQESEGWGRGENDMYIYIKVWDGPQLVYDQRLPSSGDWGGRNIVDVDFRIPVEITPNPSKAITLSIDVWEADSLNADDHLGMWTKVLDVSNGWGLNESGGILNSGSFADINSISAAVQPVVDPATLTDVDKFWGVHNQGTDDLSYQQYAAAFSDVDSDREWWDITDWLDKAFYELVIQDLAENGNCFGMSLEAINARKGRSIFSMPLRRFTDWNVVQPEVNVHHCYQVGAGPIWWFVGQFLTGNTHDPKDVFNRTREEYERGNHPVICLSQNYFFTGAPHCILPIAWDSNSKPWKITISDPNFPGTTKTLTVDPDSNEFEYIGSKSYQGGAWSGGRLFYYPYSVLSTSPRTPVWDAILLILSGTIIILGDDAQTEKLTDGNGHDLDGQGNRALQLLEQGDVLAGFFVPFKGFNKSKRGVKPREKGSVAGEILLRRRLESDEQIVGPAGVDLSQLAYLPLGELTATHSFRSIHSALFGDRRPNGRLAERALYHLANDPAAMRELNSEARKVIRTAANSALPGDFRHTLTGLRQGALNYAVKHGLSEFRLGSTLLPTEKMEIGADRLGTSTNMVNVKANREKMIRLEVTNKLGVAGDYVRIAIEQIPVSTAAPLQLNLKPGFGGLEVMTGGSPVDTKVEVFAVVDRRPVRRSFQLPIEVGARLKLSNVLSEGALAVSRIDNLLGPGRDVKIFTGQH